MRVPTIYWSADTDHNDVLLRTTALWTGHTTEQIETNMAEPAWRDYYAEQVKQGDHVDWVFDSSITPRGVKERLNAFAELHGMWPQFMVVDNLSNAVETPTDEAAQQKEVMAAMQKLARETGAHIAVLTHAKGEFEGGMKPIPKAGVLNNVFKVVDLGVTMHRVDEAGTILGLAAVKNRGGRDDPAAHHALHLEVDFSRALVKGFAA